MGERYRLIDRSRRALAGARRRSATCGLTALALAVPLVPGVALAFEGGTFHLSFGGGLERLGYQEHIDPNREEDAPLAPQCEVNGQQTRCFLDSDADLNNVLLDVRARVDLDGGAILGGSVRTHVSKGTGGEQWDIAANVNGEHGGPTRLQTDDLTYRWLRVDVFGGYRIAELLRPIGGIRISRAEQFRDSFRDANDQPLEITATEPIDSTWLMFGLLGERAGAGAAFGYRFRAGVPVSVTTTNTAIPGFEFTDVGGYVFEVGGTLAFPINPGLWFRVDVDGGAMHWNGSDVGQQGQQIAKWPENDTQILTLTAGIELIR